MAYSFLDKMVVELIKGSEAVEKRFGKNSYKTLQVTKRSKKTFVVTAEMKDGTTHCIKLKY